MERFNHWMATYFGNNVTRRRVAMIFYLLPNVILGGIAIIAFGIQIGWQKLIEPPYYWVLIYLFLTTLGAFWIRWGEIKDDEDDEKQKRQQMMKDIVTAISEANKPLLDEVRQLIIEIKGGQSNEFH